MLEYDSTLCEWWSSMVVATMNTIGVCWTASYSYCCVALVESTSTILNVNATKPDERLIYWVYQLSVLFLCILFPLLKMTRNDKNSFVFMWFVVDEKKICSFQSIDCQVFYLPSHICETIVTMHSINNLLFCLSLSDRQIKCSNQCSIF